MSTSDLPLFPRFLSDQQRRPPVVLPEHLSDEELARDWTLSPVELEGLAAFNRLYRLVNAVSVVEGNSSSWSNHKDEFHSALHHRPTAPSHDPKTAEQRRVSSEALTLDLLCSPRRIHDGRLCRDHEQGQLSEPCLQCNPLLEYGEDRGDRRAAPCGRGSSRGRESVPCLSVPSDRSQPF